MNLPTQFELFAQNYFADLKNIDNRVQKMKKAPQEDFVPKPPQFRPINSVRAKRTEKVPQKEDKNSVSLPAKLTNTPRIIRPGVFSPRQNQRN